MKKTEFTFEKKDEVVAYYNDKYWVSKGFTRTLHIGQKVQCFTPMDFGWGIVVGDAGFRKYGDEKELMQFLYVKRKDKWFKKAYPIIELKDSEEAVRGMDAMWDREMEARKEGIIKGNQKSDLEFLTMRNTLNL